MPNSVDPDRISAPGLGLIFAQACQLILYLVCSQINFLQEVTQISTIRCYLVLQKKQKKKKKNENKNCIQTEVMTIQI